MRSDAMSNATDDQDAPLLFPPDVESGGVNLTGASVNLNFVAGIIPRSRMMTFERILWRVLRGNLYMNYAEVEEPIQDPVTEEQLQKNVFVVFAHGAETLAKIRKISESLGSNVYPVDGSNAKRTEDTLEVAARIEDLNNILFNTNATKRAELAKVADLVDQWSVFVRKEKAIYHSMNLFNYDMTRKCLIAEGWCPSNSINAIQYALHAVCERSGSMVPPVLNELHTAREPPTYHKTNKVTRAFQAIVDAYGIAKYKEVNPGLFAVITFPFLFAVMFGDFGHGIMMTMAASYLVYNEKRLAGSKDEMFKMLYGGRYIVLLMGIFSIYVGLIYNDIFSIPMFLESSGWKFVNATKLDAKNQTVYFTKAEHEFTYPFGVDPRWHMASNSLLFLNSYKMKMSVIMGVIQMCFGIVLTMYNNRFFKTKINILFESVPQLLFMLSIFGYLCFLIIFKWMTNWEANGLNPPGLLNTLIFMFLKIGSVDDSMRLFSGQAEIQTFLVLLALICVPWMLCAKPLYLRYQNNRRRLSYIGRRTDVVAGYSTLEGAHGDEAAADTLSNGGESADHGGEHGGKFDMSEIIVHQVIHTIEFCLGGISNTASYLRLWALSLAHAQLSEVLWQMTVLTTINMGYAVIVGYAAWFSLTIGILLLMEGLSAFLHALRLHWVEFNGKFYAGTGTKFEPFSFQTVLDDDAE